MPSLRKVAGVAIAAVFALVALLVLTEAVIFALVSQGMALHIACLVVSGAAAVIAIIAYAASRGRAPVTPSRTLQHMSCRHSNGQGAPVMTQFRGIDPISDDNWLMTKVKQNPEAFLVMAAGCALLLRASGSRSRGRTTIRTGAGMTRAGGKTCAIGQPPQRAVLRADLQDRVKGTAAVVSEKASDYAASVTDTTSALSERAAGYASNLSDQATDWGRSAVSETARMSARAQSSIQDGLGQMIKEQPFAVASPWGRRRCGGRCVSPTHASGAGCAAALR